MKFLSLFLVAGFLVVSVLSAPESPKYEEAPPVEFELNPDGNFRYGFATGDGTSAQAQGVPKVLPGPPEEHSETITGTFKWTSPEGKVVTVTYVADESGYHPQVNQ